MASANLGTIAVADVLAAGSDPHTTPLAPYVLVVDDEAAIAETLGEVLRQAGYAVSVVYNGEDAMQLAALAPPELVITDVHMPGMTGFELALLLCKSIPDCKVVLFSASCDSARMLTAAAMAGRTFPLLRRPMHPGELLQELDRVRRIGPPPGELAHSAGSAIVV